MYGCLPERNAKLKASKMSQDDKQPIGHTSTGFPISYPAKSERMSELE